MQPHGGSKGVNETELWRSLRGKSQAKDEAVRAAEEEQLPPLKWSDQSKKVKTPDLYLKNRMQPRVRGRILAEPGG
jgi:hypothetical protein